MASAIAAFRPSIALLVGFLLIVSMAVPNAEGACNVIVGRESRSWSDHSGVCSSTRRCDLQCRILEQAKYGDCHYKNGKLMCLCYFCEDAAATTAKNKSATTSATSAKNKSATSAKNKP